jgi:hypothetical protein
MRLDTDCEFANATRRVCWQSGGSRPAPSMIIIIDVFVVTVIRGGVVDVG